MTIEEAQEILQEIKHYLTAGNPVWDVDEIAEAMNMAIEALMQESRKVTQESTQDQISRQDAIDAMARDIPFITFTEDPKRTAQRIIGTVPSADAAEVVRCKDCKWHLNGHLCKQLSQYGSIETPPSFYCGFADMRGEEE